MDTTTATREPRTAATFLRDRLIDAHRRLEALLRGVASSIRDDDRSSMHDDCALFERELLNHMDWEAMYLLPAFEVLDPVRAKAIRADHDRFRATLGRIGIEIDLHAIRAERFDEFASDLAAHAELEEALYATVDDLSDDDRAALARRHSAFFL